jgi:ribosomal protein S18 acetylase RimI-like enzyme
VVNYGPAQAADIPALADLFQQAFPEALQAVFDHAPINPRAIEDIFSFLFAFEPQGFFVARESSHIIGFTIVVWDVARLRRYFLLRGVGLKWFLRWCTGRYRGLGYKFIPRLLRAWWDYRSADADPVKENPLAQVLSLVVEGSHRGQGIGKTLSEVALAYLRTTPARVVRLEVDAAKAAPIALYKKLGFVTRATIPTPRGPALVMTLPFN